MFVDCVGVVLGFLNCGGFMAFGSLAGMESGTRKGSTRDGVTSCATVLSTEADLLFPLFFPFLPTGWLNPADFEDS